MEKLIGLGWETGAAIRDHSCCSAQSLPTASLFVALDNPRRPRCKAPGRVPSILLPHCALDTKPGACRRQGLDGMGR